MGKSLEKVVINPTKVTPYVELDPDRDVFEIRGRSSPEVSINFYNPIYEHLDNFEVENSGDFAANFALEYFNTSSTKCLLGILKRLSNIQDRGKKVIVNWYYEEDDMDVLEIGEDLSYFVDMEFNFLPLDGEGEEEEDFYF